MRQLFDALLDYHRLVHRDFQLEPVPLSEALNPITRRFARDAEQRDGEVVMPDAFPTVLGHPALIETVFSNLLDNALKFHEPGAAPRVTVTVETSGDRVLLHLSDNGLGIPSEHQEKIFDIFQRLQSTDAYAGTGIGLAVVRKALHRMNGTISVASLPGEGSTFTVQLPLAESAT
jgi:signal transduction histidine kinase